MNKLELEYNKSIDTKLLECELCKAPVVVSVYTHRTYCSECRTNTYRNNSKLKASYRYRHSEKGHEAKLRFETYPLANCMLKYKYSEKGKITRRIHNQKYEKTEKRINYIQRYRQSDRVKRLIYLRSLKYNHKKRKERHLSRYAKQFNTLFLIRKTLNKKMYSEKTFFDLVNINKKRIRVDAWIPSLLLVIEINGKQHYSPLRFGNISMERAIENTINYQTRDKIIKDYCKQRGYKLLIIPYSVTRENTIINLLVKKISEEYER